MLLRILAENLVTQIAMSGGFVLGVQVAFFLSISKKNFNEFIAPVACSIVYVLHGFSNGG